LVQQINDRSGQDVQEVVLTGTQLGTYGFDIPGMTLPGLLERLLRETSIPRIRVSSLQAQEISPALLDLWRDERLCPHFHVPLQCGSDPVLLAMRRRYTTAQFAKTLDSIRDRMPDAGITTDVIVGFPGEGGSEFKASRDFAELMRFGDMHVFPFSPRPGTSAAYLNDDTPPQVKKERTAEMLEVARRGATRFRLGQLGKVRPALWESSGRGEDEQGWWGLTDNYIRVNTVSGHDLRDRITQTKLTSLDGEVVSVEVQVPG
jgi:threonylcarbamoyladenosine tRNA methylthiotransferase MtaB